MRVLLALALVALLLIFWEAHRELSLDHRLSGVASEIAGRSVSVDCPGFLRGLIDISGHGGSVRFDADGKPSNTTQLETHVCQDLSAYVTTRKRADFACVFGTTYCSDKVERAVYAVLVLSHESQHLRGVRSESEAQCYAIQTAAQVAERLGSPPAEASAVAAHYLAVEQPSMPDEYSLPDGCEDGGSLDLNQQSTSWPTG
ncbi:MAG TPA: hypothetical protein VII83_09105 [Gaiellaceae bacterium]